MLKKILITLIVLLILLGLFIWMTGRVTVQDMSMGLAVSNSQPIPLDLEGRRLVWGSNANVPIELEWGGEGHNLLGLMGIPENLQPLEINIGRTPIRDEWNIATIVIGSPGKSLEPTFLTENIGSFLNMRQSASGEIIVATHHVGESQDVIILDISSNEIEKVSSTPSLDRWPSVSADGNKIIFHSYRGGNPGGDLFLAERADANPYWEVFRLTDDPSVEYILPYIDPNGNLCVAVERNLGMEDGFVTLWELDGHQLFNRTHPFYESALVKHPTMSENAEILCWEKMVGDCYYIYTWTEDDGELLIGPADDPPHSGWGWVQPSISPDGNFISFIDAYKGYGEDRIGIYELETGSVTYFEGCGGNIMFPSLSNPLM